MKNRTFKKGIVILLAVLMIFGLLVPGAFATSEVGISPLSASPPDTIENIFPDPVLAEAIAQAFELDWNFAGGVSPLPVPVGVNTVVSQADLDLMIRFAGGGAIQDLDGIQYLVNLYDLRLQNGEISDLSPLAGLTSLTLLHLANNEISDLSPLAGLTSLPLLNLSGNEITDIAPLAGMTGLVTLYIDNNQISDLSPLAPLTNLEFLWAFGNEISDITPLAALTNLQELFIGNNEISDVSPLTNLTNLTSLHLNNNQISDISPLAGVATGTIDSLIVSDQQVTLSPPIPLSNPLVVTNDVFLLDGTRVTPNPISNGGTSAAPYDTVTWTALPDTVTEVSYQFSATFPITWGTGSFSGTVIQPLTPAPVTSVSIPGGNFQLNTNATRQLTAAVVPTYAANQAVTWSSSDTAVATVTAGGLVQGIAPGTATITVTTADGGFTASVIVTVVAAPPWQPPPWTPPIEPEPDPEPEYRFLDVNSDHWFYEAVMFIYEQNVMQGINDTQFAPNATLTRGMVATILHRLYFDGTPPVSSANHGFGDVAPGTWYANAVAWAFENGIVQGVSATSFAPNDPITREQLATMLHRYAEFTGVNISVSAGANLDRFADAYRVSSWAEDAKLWANYNDLITGRTTTTIVPGGTANRAEAATILMRFIQNF